MNKKIIIVSGGMLEEEFALSVIKEDENAYIIGVDRGMEFLYRNHIMPSYIVGDFDSVNKDVADYYRNETQVPIREYNPVKDASDTEIAVRFAMTLGCGSLVILGATGGRVDHLWANVQTLAIPFRAGIRAEIMDSRNLGQEILGFNIEGAKYPLKEHLLTPYDSLCVSNQIEDEEVKISFPSGIVILMESRD